jgi:hypothetical protein
MYIYICIYVSFLLCSCFNLTCVCVCVYIYIYIYTYIYIYINIHIHMLYSCVLNSCFTSLHVCNCCIPVLLQYIHLYSCFTRTLLVLFLLYVCVRVCRLTGLVECVEQSEGLRRDGGWEHAGLQQRPAGQAPLHEPPPVCVLMHVGAAQARTRLQERLRVSTAEQVRDACHMMASYPI